MASVKAEKKDRKLGDEWGDWDGGPADVQTSAGKRLFLLFGLLTIAFSGLMAGVAWYLVTPRLLQWHPLVPRLLLGALALAVILLGAVQLALVASLLFGFALPRPLRGLVRGFLGLTEARVQRMGQRMAVNRDRLAHSYIKVHNALERLDSQGELSPDELLVLLPRCLTREQLNEARELCQEAGTHVAVVAGGELARKRIMQLRPRAIVGVACERDLLSGVRDVGGNGLRVLGIPNARPDGPCKDTVIQLNDLREAIRFYTGVQTST